MSAPGLKITNFHYSNMKMPDGDVSIRDYPKWVHMTGYEDVIAESPEHEAELLARPSKTKDDPVTPAPKVPEVIAETPKIILTATPDEREILLQIAKEKNIKVDARWKTDRIKATIERETKDL